MRLEIYDTPAVFESLQPEWNPLLHRSRLDTIFLTVDWQMSWWEVFHPGRLHVVVGRTEDGELAGIAPWFIHEQCDCRILRTIGCVDVTDYLGVIVAEEYEQPFFTALAEHLAELTGVFDLINLCNIPEGSAILEKFPPLLEAQGFETTIEQQEVCPIIQLPASWDAYLALLNKKQRHELRRKIRRVGIRANWYIVGPEHDLDAEIDRFLQLMAASSGDKSAFLLDEKNTAFFYTMIPRMMAQGWLQLNFLTIDDEVAATYLNFDYNNTILVYNSGQDLARFGNLSAGIVLLSRNIRYAIEQGRSEFDFLRGNETYKYQMGGQDTAIYKLKARRN